MFSRIHFPWVFFFNWMPRPRRFFWFGSGFVIWYGGYYEAYKKAVTSYHRSQLRRLDIEFRMTEASLELVKRRNKARDSGMDPLDPDYPELKDVL